MDYLRPGDIISRSKTSMNILLERVNEIADEIIDENLFMDMTE